MEEKGSKQNSFFTLIKFFLFLIVFCFVISITKEFFREMRSHEGLNINILFFSALSAFSFYTFVVDLNGVYKKIQNFFFHSSFLSYLIPSFLILMGIGYFILPKAFNLEIDKEIFVFLGGFVVTSHLIFVARDNKGKTFSGVINYLFNFSILYIISLLLFSVYLMAAFEINLSKILVDGLTNGAMLIKNLFNQVLH
ncbi:MAG: hypothetical protein PHP17_01865 [Candidatus Omnitrophica bacterium]|nr:hypothetical protein [Candidatus Omnitrophota bacterium]